VLLVGASGLLTLNLGNPLIRGLPADSEERQAYRAATQGFAPGVLSPSVLVVAAPGVTERRRALAELQRRLSGQRGVAQVVGPGDQPTGVRFGAALSRTGDAARFFIVLRSDPLGGRAVNDLRRIQRRLPSLLADAGLESASASFAGDTALVVETVDKTVSDLARIAPAVLGIIFIILALFLRALIAPLYLVGASVLALLASLGLATYLLGDVQGYGEMTYFVPIAAAVLLASLGSDYNVFLAGRIWQEARTRPLHEAVVVAGAEAARPIAIAGIVLAASFALLALVPVRSFRELALTMGLGLLIDAFLVRAVLVPALILLVGERGGWPGRRLRRIAKHGEAAAVSAR
jgi:RND superfamily putative drug exporter